MRLATLLEQSYRSLGSFSFDLNPNQNDLKVRDLALTETKRKFSRPTVERSEKNAFLEPDRS